MSVTLTLIIAFGYSSQRIYRVSLEGDSFAFIMLKMRRLAIGINNLFQSFDPVPKKSRSTARRSAT
jgi:hypothetical protein